MVAVDNQTRTSNHRVGFHLIGTKSNRAAIGPRVTIHAAGVMQFNEVRGGGSYLSERPAAVLRPGAADKIDGVEVTWPSGQAELQRDVPSDFIYTITEGQGITARLPLPPPLKPNSSASAATANR